MRSAIETLSAVSRSVIEFSALLMEIRVVWRSDRSAFATSVTSAFDRKNVGLPGYRRRSVSSARR
jgi:hypothetical protein